MDGKKIALVVLDDHLREKKTYQGLSFDRRLESSQKEASSQQKSCVLTLRSLFYTGSEVTEWFPKLIVTL